MIKVTNPTESPIEIQYRGVVYHLDAGESKAILDEAAIYWRTNIHNFVTLEDVNTDAPVTTETTVEEEAPIEAPVEEDVPEETEVEEAPVEEEVKSKK